MVRTVVLSLCAGVLLLSGSQARAAGPASSRPIDLSVDATEAPRKLLHARLVIPATPGPLTLCYPKWIQGEHAPTGPIADLAGLQLRAGGKPLSWRRDDEDFHAFHCTIPAGAEAVEVSLDYLGVTSKGAPAGESLMTAQLAMISWHHVLLYPRGRPVRDLPVRARLTLPRGWKLGTAVPVESEKDGVTHFQVVSLATLVDSPVLCGAHFKEVPVGPAEGPPHFLLLACDGPAGLEISSELKGHYEQLVAEARALFGARHYRSYRFLVALSDHMNREAVEHHESSDNRLPERLFLEEDYRKLLGDILPHEFVHSWNGKYRRPAGLVAPDFQQPLRTKLLWVYEGLTQYLGFVLAARSGLHTPKVARENLALIAEWARNQQGRTWRSLEDTAVAAPHLYFTRSEWATRRRGVDFYDEGVLLWLDADTRIRAKTGGKKSLDDFCRAFFGGKDGPPEVLPYGLEDVVRALNEVVADDWQGFLMKRVTATESAAPLDGLTRGGWKLDYRDKPGDLHKARDDEDKSINLTASIGLLLKEDGQVTDVVPGKAADAAGIAPGMKLVAINGRRWTVERLREAVSATRNKQDKLLLLLENQDFFTTYTLDYQGGEKYPHLERDPTNADVLSEIFRPRCQR